jgi:hypothetical protein
MHIYILYLYILGAWRGVPFIQDCRNGDGWNCFLWTTEFRELFFNPLPLKRLCNVMCLISAAMLVTDYFDKAAELGYHERLGIAEHEGEHFWQLMSTIGYATPDATGVIPSSIGRHWGVSTYRWNLYWGVSTFRYDVSHPIMPNLTYNDEKGDANHFLSEY